MRYKLSKNIVLSDIDREDASEIPDQYLQDHYILYDELKDKEFLINGTVKYFLDKFCDPKDEREVLREVQEDISHNSLEVEEVCSTFWKFLATKKIIVPEDYTEPDRVKASLFTQGDSFQQFEVLEVLSIRKYLDLYLVQEGAAGTPCVAKLLDRNKIPDERVFNDELRELKMEFLMLKKVDSVSFISHAYDFFSNERYAYFTLEYIDGVSLGSFLTNFKELTKKDSFRIMENILDAFSQLHQLGLIHGDIHSSNILITATKEVKIIDLGLSKTVHSEENQIVKFGGVDYYMPPERINKTSIRKHMKGPDLSSDVYQLGLLLYLVLYNAMPFKAYTWEDLSKSIKEAPVSFESISFLNYPVPLWLTRIVEKCLHKNPGMRYKNAAEILADFKMQNMYEKQLE